MKKIFCGTSGTDTMPKGHRISDIPCDAKLLKALQKFYRGDLTLRPAQEEAIFGTKILERAENVIVTTPTNSGKSLLSYLLLLKHAVHGHRVVLIEPLRALAQEKGLELTEIAEYYRAEGGDKVRVVVTTGDYRTTGDFLNTKPQAYSGGQIVIATPERLDAISREPKNKGWMKKIVFVCLDEAHLIGDASRGVTIELLLTYLRTLDEPPRIALMSATISNASELADWLKPCVVTKSVARYPKLDKYVYALENGEDATEKVFAELDGILKDENASAIVFVYQTSSAEKAARDYVKRISGKTVKAKDLSSAIEHGVAWYHAQLESGKRQHVVDLVTEGKVRVTFTTTALGMGVNLPATHVLVRDVVFAGAGRELDVADFLQMLGRAGRGDRNGVGIVFAKDESTRRKIEDGLKNEIVPKVISRLCPPEEDEGWYGRKKDNSLYEDRVGAQVLGALYRLGSATEEKLEEYFSNSFGGSGFTGIHKLLERYATGVGQDWNLVHFDEETNEYKLTTLGEKTAASYLPPRTAARIGCLVRALLQDDATPERDLGAHLRQMTELDWLIVVCTASADIKVPLKWSESLPQKLGAEIEGLKGEKSYLYNMWIKAEPVILYKSICFDAKVDDECARKEMIKAALGAVLIYRMSQGDDLEKLGGAYNVPMADLHEKLRDNCIWQLAALDGIMDPHCFFYAASKALEEAGLSEVRDIKLKAYDIAFKGQKEDRRKNQKEVESIRAKLFGLIADLKFRSKLGKMIRSIKMMFPKAKRHPGEKTIQRLEQGGILSLRDLVGKKGADIEALGVEKEYAQMIVAYIRSRLA